MIRILFVLGAISKAAIPPTPYRSQFDAKPIDQMTYAELLVTGKEALNNVTLIHQVRGNVHVTRLQEVLKAVCSVMFVFRVTFLLVCKVFTNHRS